MITALLSFLGGNVFRMIFGEAVSYFNKRQDHGQELELMRAQGELDAAQHERTQIAIKTQFDIGVKTVQVQSEAYVANVEVDAWFEAVKATAIKTGVAWIDGWNAIIRPGVATWSVVMLTLAEIGAIAKLSENVTAICAVALGIYLAERNLMKRGK